MKFQCVILTAVTALVSCTDALPFNTITGAKPRAGGVALTGPRTLAWCIDNCDRLGGLCFGAIYNSDKQRCEVLMKRESCRMDGLKSAEDTYYRSKSCGSVGFLDGRSAGLCSNASPYATVIGSAPTGGTADASGSFFLGGFISINACIALCDARRGCVSVLWNFSNGNTCYGYSSTPAITVVDPPCCFVLNKICGGIATTTTTTTTTTAPTTTTTPSTTTTTAPTTTVLPTTTVPSFANTGIGTGGKCPLDEFASTNSSRQIGGTLIYNFATETICLRACLQDNTCGAVDFNYQTLQCIKHTMHDPVTYVRGTEACCAHFVKNVCSNTCYMSTGTAMAAATSTELEVTLPSTTGVSLTTCPNDLCQVTYVLDETDAANPMVTVSRGCAMSASIPDYACSSSIVAPVTTSTCVCKGSRCNALDNTLPMLYLPLDSHTSDYSGFMRDARLFGATFENLDTARNWSLSFNAASYATVPAMLSVRIGDTTAATLGSLTVAFWMKRTSIAGNMGLLHNGIRGTAPIEIVSGERSVTNHVITASFRYGQTTTWTVSGDGYMNEWHFVAAVLSRDAGMTTATLYVTDPSAATPTVTMLAVTGPTADTEATAPLRDSGEPLYLGASRALGTGIFFEQTDFLRGMMDEVYVFSTALTMAQLQALVDTTRAV